MVFFKFHHFFKLFFNFSNKIKKSFISGLVFLIGAVFKAYIIFKKKTLLKSSIMTHLCLLIRDKIFFLNFNLEIKKKNFTSFLFFQ